MQLSKCSFDDIVVKERTLVPAGEGAVVRQCSHEMVRAYPSESITCDFMSTSPFVALSSGT